MADVLDTRLLQAQTEQMAPLARPARGARHRRAPTPRGPAARPATQAGALSRHRPLARRLRLRLQQEDQPRPRLRARHRAVRCPARRRTPARPARYGQESSRPSHRTGRDPAGLPRHLPRFPREHGDGPGEPGDGRRAHHEAERRLSMIAVLLQRAREPYDGCGSQLSRAAALRVLASPGLSRMAKRTPSWKNSPKRRSPTPARPIWPS